MQNKTSKRYGLESLTEAIRQARLAKGWSQRDLSARAHLTQAQISRIENGEVDMQVSTLIELARSLDLDLQLVPRNALVAVEAAVRSAEERSDERSARNLLSTLRRLAEEAERAEPEREDIASIASTLRDLEPQASAFRGPFLIADLERLKTNLEGFLTYPPASRPRHAKPIRDAAAWLREYPLLEVLGPDLPGAVTVRPLGEGELNEDDEDQHEDETKGAGGQGALRFSLAGVQLKFSAVEKAQGGLTIPASGRGGDWIIKLPSIRFRGVAANEFAMMRLARAMGMDIPDVELVPLDQIEGLPEGIGKIEEEAFAIRRFDRREDGGRIHIEDFAQVFGVYPGEKYDKGSYRYLAKVLWLETGEAGVREFIRRLVFNTLIGNADMHLKNWSLIYRDGRTPELSPGYDFLSTTVYIPDENAALKYARTKRMAEFSLDEIGYMAARAGLPEALARDAAIEAVDRFHEVWGAERAHLPIADDLAVEVERLLGVVPLARAR